MTSSLHGVSPALSAEQYGMIDDLIREMEVAAYPERVTSE